jgi:hypothetical protein
MFEKQKTGIIIVVMIFAAMSQLFAQHNKLLYHHPLTSNDPNPIGQVQVSGGDFSDRGWRPTWNIGDQIKIETTNVLPFEGTLEVTVSGLLPDVNNEWVPIALHSRAESEFHSIDREPASYAFMKGDDHYADYDLDFRIFTSAFYGYNRDTQRTDSDIAVRTWKASKEYVFKVIWDHDTIKWTVDGERLAEHPFLGQIESFRYIYLGRDEQYPSTMMGVYFKDLKVWVPETEYPVTNIADPEVEMANLKLGTQGVTIADFDNNGEEDIYLSRFYNIGFEHENLSFMQNNDAFTDESSIRGADDASYSYQTLAGDFDNDGDKDLFVVNYYNESASGNGPNRLYLNDGFGNFTDRTSDMSGNTADYWTGGTMLDIENDGDLDVVVINAENQHTVYVNDGSARFNTQSRGLQNFNSSSKSYKRATAGDLDNDGFQDLVIVHKTGIDVARNDGAGQFVFAAQFPVPEAANAATLADIDNDADLDILVGAASSTSNSSRVEIFRNDGNFSFVNISSVNSIQLDTHGILTGDWNNDGFIDMFSIDQKTTGKLFVNNGAGIFSQVSGTGAEAQFADGRGAATLDLNDDGLLDIYGGVRGGYVADGKTGEEKPFGRNYLFRNDIADAGNFLKVNIVDENERTSGVGDKVYVYEAGGLNNAARLLGYREVLATNGFNSQGSWVQHFGVGSESAVDVKIILPNGSERTYPNVPTNQTMVASPIMAVPTTMQRDFNESQPAVAGELFEIAYKLLSAEQEPVANYPVSFEVLQGNGSFDPNSIVTNIIVNTDQTGRAVVSWLLGPVSGVSGLNEVRVSADWEGTSVSGSPDAFTVISQAGDAAQLLDISGNDQMGFVNADLENELTTRVVDQNGNPVVAHTVEFTVSTGGGMLKSGASPSSQVYKQTDSNGYAKVTWQMGPTLGQQTVNARAENGQGANLINSPITFRATAQEPLSIMQYISGNGQTGSVNAQLADPLVVRLFDSDNVPLAGEPVKFIATTFNGQFSGKDSVFVNTNSQGYAQATPTLGNTVGDSIYVFKAYAENASGSPVEFKASATAGPPAKIEYIAGNGQSASAGRTLPIDLKVRVLDAGDRPVKSHSVQFSVTEGGGLINGAENKIILTDSQGFASVSWKIGESVGQNKVIAAAQELNEPPVVFTAIGVVGQPARLSKYSGDTQKGEAGLPLPQYFVVSVTDSFYNAIANHPVTFRVNSGGGNLEGQTQRVVYTNAFGQAQVLYTMGPTDFEQSVNAIGDYDGTPLIGSPQVFSVFLGPGDPENLVDYSGNNQIGAVNQELPEPFIVKVLDANGVGVSNIEVEFITFSQGASFFGNPSIKVRTNPDGFASATAAIGSSFGTNNYVFEAIGKYDGKNLKGSPLQFYASGRRSLAKKIQKVNSNEVITGAVGSVLGDSLQVLVLDENDVPVPGHPVTFQTHAGLALIQAQYTNHTVNSNAYGIASVGIKLGTRPGASVIRASSDDGVNPLTPDFLEYNLMAETGAPSALTSTIEAETNLIADGQTATSLNITLLDEFRNPVVGAMASLQSNNLEVLTSQPTQATDENGFVTGSVASINVGTASIWVLVNNQPVVSTEIKFIPGPPAIALKINDGQTQEKGKSLDNPVGVEVQDAYGHPIENLNVFFSVTSGNGSILEAQPTKTNELGRAMVTWILGDVQGTQELSANIDGLPATKNPVSLRAYAMLPSQGIVSMVSGDSLIGLVNQNLAEPFKIRVSDSSGAPLTNIPVTFSLGQLNGGFVTSAQVNTNSQGEAMIFYRAGSESGMDQVVAVAQNYGSVLFNFIIQSERTLFISKQSELPETVRPKILLSAAIKVVDAYNRAVAHESINFLQTQGQSYIEQNLPISTNSEGMVNVTWTMGTAGPQEVEIDAVDASNAPTFYRTIVVNSAPAFEPELPHNLTKEAEQNISFEISAVDPDGDAVFYLTRNFPEGAEINTETPRMFDWTPTVDQVGDYSLTIIAMDEFGASDSSIVNITVGVRNHAPVITSFSPPDTIRTIGYGHSEIFEVRASDVDGDPLNYTWEVDGSYAGDSYISQIAFIQEQFPDSTVIVEVKISDIYNAETSMRWYIHLSVKASVELSQFMAVADDNSVNVEWQTSKEEGTVGFYVLKSTRKSGPFEAVNTELIPSRSDGQYRYIDKDVKAGSKYYYKLREIDIYGTSTDHGQIEAQIALPTSVALAQNYPNPFNPTTTIRFELPATNNVSLSVFNATGQLVRTLANGEFAAGVHQLIWDARDDAGMHAPSGIYYYRMTTGGFSQTRKLLLLK